MEQAITALGKDGFVGVYAANDGTAGGAIAAMKGAGIDPKTMPVHRPGRRARRDPADPRRRPVHDGLQADQAAGREGRRVGRRAGQGQEAAPTPTRPRTTAVNVPTIKIPVTAVTAGQRQDDRHQGRALEGQRDLHRRVRGRLQEARDPVAGRKRDASGDSLRQDGGLGYPAPGAEGSDQALRRRARPSPTSTSRSTPARSSRSSATTAPASPRSIKAIAGHPARRRGRGPLRRRSASSSTRRRTRPRSGSRPSTRTSRCATTSTSSRTCSSARGDRGRIAGAPRRSTRSRWSSSRSSCCDSLAVTTLRSVRTEVGSLSGGQRQSVAIARSLLGEPKIVMLDEPTAALGVAQTARCSTLIQRLRERGLGVVVISHNLADVFEVADRIIVLRLGRASRPSSRRDDAATRSSPRSPGARCRRRHELRTETDRRAPSQSTPHAPDADAAASTRSRAAGLLLGRPARRPARARLAPRLLVLAVIWIIFQIAERQLPQLVQPHEPRAADRGRRA